MQKLSLSLQERRRVYDLLINGHDVESATSLLHAQFHAHLPIELVRTAYFPGGGALRTTHLVGKSKEEIEAAFVKAKTAFETMQKRGPQSASRLQSKDAQEKASETKWSDPSNVRAHAERTRKVLAKRREDPKFKQEENEMLAKASRERANDPEWVKTAAAQLEQARQSEKYITNLSKGVQRFLKSKEGRLLRKQRKWRMKALRRDPVFEKARLDGLKNSDAQANAARKTIQANREVEEIEKRRVTRLRQVKFAQFLKSPEYFQKFMLENRDKFTHLELATLSVRFSLNLNVPESTLDKVTYAPTSFSKVYFERAMKKIRELKSINEN